MLFLKGLLVDQIGLNEIFQILETCSSLTTRS